jgi:serine/threonine protein kinase
MAEATLDPGEMWDLQACIISRKEHTNQRSHFKTARVYFLRDTELFFNGLVCEFSDGRRHRITLFGKSVFVTQVKAISEDVAPSFAENTLCIRSKNSTNGWLFASPTEEAMTRLADRLSFGGCTMRDMQDHFRPILTIKEDILLGKPTSSRLAEAMTDVLALKVATTDTKEAELLNEIRFLLNLKHEGILRAYGIYTVKLQGKEGIGMLLDSIKGQDLEKWIPDCGFSEQTVQAIMPQICDALVYLHGIRVVHRDVKLSNVFCECGVDGTVRLVLSDFGLAAHIDDAAHICKRCGTAGFIAPEMYRKDWTTIAAGFPFVTKIDVYSFGMIIYTAVAGKNPFVRDSLDATYRRNARGLLPFGNGDAQIFSPELQGFLCMLCAVEPATRFWSSEAADHPWFSAARTAANDPKVTWASFEEESNA